MFTKSFFRGGRRVDDSLSYTFSYSCSCHFLTDVLNLAHCNCVFYESKLVSKVLHIGCLMRLLYSAIFSHSPFLVYC